MTREELKQAGTKKLISALQYCGRDGYYVTFYDEVVDEITQRLNRIEELDKENGKLEGKLADLQSEYVELENLHNNIVNELKAQLTKAKEIIQDMLRDIPNRMWYTDATIKEAEQFLKEADE